MERKVRNLDINSEMFLLIVPMYKISLQVLFRVSSSLSTLSLVRSSLGNRKCLYLTAPVLDPFQPVLQTEIKLATLLRQSDLLPKSCANFRSHGHMNKPPTEQLPNAGTLPGPLSQAHCKATTLIISVL